MHRIVLTTKSSKPFPSLLTTCWQKVGNFRIISNQQNNHEILMQKNPAPVDGWPIPFFRFNHQRSCSIMSSTYLKPAGPLQPPTWQVHLLFGHGLVSLGTALITLWCRHGDGEWHEKTYAEIQVQLSMMKRAFKNQNIGDGCILCVYIYKSHTHIYIYNYCIYIYTWLRTK